MTTSNPNLGTVYTGLTPAQGDGLACVVCHRDYLADPRPSRPVGIAVDTGSQVFACSGACHTRATASEGGSDDQH
jgi:hypothetical protein